MNQQVKREVNRNGGIMRTALLLAAAMTMISSSSSAATFNVSVDSPTALRLTFTGEDTNPSSLGDGNDFAVATFGYWNILVNLRGDAVAKDGSVSGFYEIQARHSGSVLADPTAPL